MSDAVIVELIRGLSLMIPAVCSWLALKQSKKNSVAIEAVKAQTNGLTEHLVAITATSSKAEGKKEEKEEEEIRRKMITPLESRVGPDRLNAGPRDRPA